MKQRHKPFWCRGDACVALTLMLLLLTACVPATAAPTETVTLQPSSTVTETPEATNTSLPAQTATPTWPPIPTNTPLPVPYPERYNGVNSFSPYDDWVAWSVRTEEQKPLLRVENFDQTVVWEAESDLPARYYDLYMLPFFWSSDGRFLYFQITGPSDGGYDTSVLSLSRLELSNGNVVKILDISQLGYFAVEISPTGRSLAYIPGNRSTLDVYIYDLTTQQTRKYPFGEQGDFNAGRIIWYEDETKLAFGVENYDTYRGNIFVLELEEDTGELVAQFEAEQFRPEIWISENELLIVHRSEQLIVNVNTNELTPATSEP